MSYRVVKYFTDLTDNNHAYNTGDTFPRDGLIVPKSRISELCSSNNKLGQPVIEKIGGEEPVESVPVNEVEDSSEKQYTEEELENMTTKEIKTVAAERGYKITKNSKFDVIAQFMKAQKKR